MLAPHVPLQNVVVILARPSTSHSPQNSIDFGELRIHPVSQKAQPFVSHEQRSFPQLEVREANSGLPAAAPGRVGVRFVVRVYGGSSAARLCS